MKNSVKTCALVMIGVLFVAVPLALADKPENDDKSKRLDAKALNRTLNTRVLEDRADESDPGLGIEKRGFQPTKGGDDARLSGMDDHASNDDSTNPFSADDEDAELIVICHKPGTPNEQTLMVPMSALKGHLKHGDVEGPCPGDQSPTDNIPG